MGSNLLVVSAERTQAFGGGRFDTARLAIFGDQVASNLLGSDPCIAEIIRIEKMPFEVVGVLAPKGITPEGANEDDRIIISLRSTLRRVFNQNYIKTVSVEAPPGSTMPAAESQIRRLLCERHRIDVQDRPDDFTIQNLLTSFGAEQGTTESFTMLITAIAAISCPFVVRRRHRHPRGHADRRARAHTRDRSGHDRPRPAGGSALAY